MPKLPDTAVCLRCGYSLRGLPDNVCPECGSGFAPSDRRTWRDTAQQALWVRLALRWSHAPPGWHCGMTIVVTLLLLLWMSLTVWPFAPQYDGHEFFEYSIPILLPTLLLLFPLIVSYVLRWVACRRFRRRRIRLHRTSWLVLPASLLALLVASLYPWPLVVRFAVSRPWFDRAARQVSAGESITGTRLLGLFGVSKINLWEPGRVRFKCWGDFDIQYDARTRPESPHYVARIGRHWYVWVKNPLYIRWPHPTTTRVFPPSPFFCMVHSAMGL